MNPPAKHMSALAISWAVLALAIICCLLIKQTEAGGGKGKGGRGHIIVQNEVKGSQVPVYMPIPIPIPMPVGPPPPPPAPHHGMGEGHSKMFQHPSSFGQDNDDEGEVRKIYLLQPMPRPRPQPQLKGGGFMGPIQNHIHLGQHEQSLANKHRHAASFGQQQQQQISQEGDVDLRPQEKHVGIKSASSDVKILPIVVIPPVAPMPPIQIPNSPSSQSTSNTHRLMFSPQFNNFLVTGDRTRRRQKQHSFSRGTSNGGDTFADYGGSVGGSVFRDNFMGRGRSARSRVNSLQANEGASSSRSRDFDYGDFDYDNSQPAGSASSYMRPSEDPSQMVARRRHHRMASAGSFPVQRRYQRQFAPQTSVGSQRHKSIRDIIEAHKAARLDDYDQAVNNDQQVDYVSGEGDSSGLPDSQPASLSNLRFARNQSPTGFEISLDDLNSQLAAADTQQHNRVQRMHHNQDLSSFYYDHGDLASSASKVASRPSGSSLQTIGSPERDIFEDDQWRLDTIKSVKHAASNATMTLASNSTSTSRSSNGLQLPGGAAKSLQTTKLDSKGA